MFRSGFRPAAVSYAVIAITALVINSPIAYAFPNDGGIAMGGSPGLLNGHPSVTMEAEKIRILVGEDAVKVDCDFTFTNHGPACTVRMGFPDRGIGAMDPDEERSKDDIARTPPQTTFTSFKSWVSGKPAKTGLVRANKGGEYWHTKMVSFKANETLHVRDLYTQDIGGGLASIDGKPGEVKEAAYVLHTGASWHGPIGSTEVTVVFKNSRVQTPIHAIQLKMAATGSGKANGASVAKLPVGAVVWSGPSQPEAGVASLKFVRKNWVPTKKDDIDIFCGYRTAN